MSTPAQIIANLVNARHSTGPGSPAISPCPRAHATPARGPKKPNSAKLQNEPNPIRKNEPILSP